MKMSFLMDINRAQKNPNKCGEIRLFRFPLQQFSPVVNLNEHDTATNRVQVIQINANAVSNTLDKMWVNRTRVWRIFYYLVNFH